MKSIQFQLLLCLGLFAVLCLSLPNHFQVRNARLCGQQLADTLQMICQNDFYELKRGFPSSGRGHKLLKNILDAESRPAAMEGLLDSQMAMEFFPRQDGREKRGVVEECCQKSCSYSDLLQYCNGK